MSLCASCHGGCCRSLLLIITAWDALRLSRDLERSPESFTQFIPLGESQTEALQGLPAQIRFSDTQGPLQNHTLVLKKEPSQLLPGTHRCTFLLEWPQENADPEASHPGGRVTGRCGVYGSRPLMCRTYPALLDDNNQPVITYRRSMQAPQGEHALCPKPWTPEMFGNDPSATAHNLILERYEFDFFNAAVERWNETPRPRSEFFPFMTKEYQHRIRAAEASELPEEIDLPSLSLSDIFPQYRVFKQPKPQ